jgi:FkbM family methyltransferase
MQTLKELAADYKAERISRESYWTAMQARHLQLRQYQDLIAGTDVGSIEIHPDELRIVTRECIAMAWQPEDLRTAPNVLVDYGVYEPEESPVLLASAAGAQVVFDIGANAGFYSLHWLSRLAQGGQVHAFEPVPSTYARLARNVELNSAADRIHINNFGMGDEPKKISIFLPEFSGSGAASIKNLHPEEKSIEVEVSIDTLDRYFAAAKLDRLDLVKVDVEGAELMVLQGGRQTLSRHQPLLFLELLRKWSKPFGYHPNDVIALLSEFGYDCCSFENGKLIRFHTVTDETRQTNFFFAHPQKHGAWLARHGLG